MLSKETIINILISDPKEREEYEEFMRNRETWKKLLSPNQITEALAKATAEGDYSFHEAMLISSVIPDAINELFPREEYEAMFGPVRKKGDKDGSK